MRQETWHGTILGWGRGSQLSSERGKEQRIYLENRAAAQPRQPPHCTTSQGSQGPGSSIFIWGKFLQQLVDCEKLTFEINLFMKTIETKPPDGKFRKLAEWPTQLRGTHTNRRTTQHLGPETWDLLALNVFKSKVWTHYFPRRLLETPSNCNKSLPEDSRVLNRLAEWNKLRQLHLNEYISINISIIGISTILFCSQENLEYWIHLFSHLGWKYCPSNNDLMNKF